MLLRIFFLKGAPASAYEPKLSYGGRASSLNVKMAWTHLKVIMIRTFVNSIAFYAHNIHKIIR